MKAVLAYDGSRYRGWARQAGCATVEQEVLDALARVIPGWRGRLICAGRTDAGVHARGQVVQFDVPTGTEPPRLLRSLNAVLPPDIRIYRLEAAPEGFDARFAALWRRYRYLVTDGIPDPLVRHTVLSWRDRLDADIMDAAVQVLVGEHDFGSFCKPRAGATTIRKVLQCRWHRAPDGLVVFDITADAFCHSMVRSVVGASLLVGAGRRPPESIAELLRSPSRENAAPVAPPHGLVLVEVCYPPDGQLAHRVAVARTRRDSAQSAP